MGHAAFRVRGNSLRHGSFKEHCALHVWKGSLIVGDGPREAMGQFGRITRSSDLPSEYADWISEAKREDTRKRRADTAVEWMAEGKSRNWNYEKR